MADELFDIQDKSDLPERLADASSPAAAQDTGRPNTVISHAGSVSVHSMAMSFVVLVRCMRCTCMNWGCHYVMPYIIRMGDSRERICHRYNVGRGYCLMGGDWVLRCGISCVVRW